MRKRIVLITLFLTAGMLHAVPAGSVQDIFSRANDLYKNEDYTGALGLYRYLADTLRMEHPAVYFNAGNSAYRTGQTGQAVIYYERARRLAPRDTDIAGTLQFVRYQLRDRVTAPSPFIFIRWAREATGSFSTGELVALTQAGYLLLALLLVILLLRRSWWIRLKPVVIVAAVFFIAGGTALTRRLYHTHFTREAVITSAKVDVYSGPAARYTLQFILHEGTKVQMLKESEGWHLVELASGEKGWIPAESLERI